MNTVKGVLCPPPPPPLPPFGGNTRKSKGSGSLYDVDTGGSDTYGNRVEISHLESADGIATHSQDTVLPLHQ